MNTRWVRGALLLVTMALVSSCSQLHKEPAPAGSNHGREDARTIGEVFGLAGAHPLIGFLDPESRTVYVAERAIARVKKVFNVREDKGQAWIIDEPPLKGEYKVASLNTLDLGRALNVGMVAVNEKSTCEQTKKGECSNMYDDRDVFSYSWTAPKDLYQCEWTETQDCKETIQEVTVDVYKQKDCKGQSNFKKEKISFCNPA
jgi:hypothetical protein